ncbi:KPN_02809 family neutral zinc metallopeptidase [Frigoribacterium sp. 2-23]|uniref:KPN_02809 family neutral zinc metallopeptidase n=1 Tax=Frigoribacterium sp. 2-23 TaxID=3415006 RepID=UPI003C6FCB5E
MSFNPNAKIDGSKVTRRGRTTGIAAGGGIVGIIVVALIAQFTGVDVSGLLAGTTGSSQQTVSDSDLSRCKTGEQANDDIECRMVGAADSLETYWQTEAPQIGVTDYTRPDFVLFTGATTTGCGNATSATGPFYCPPDRALFVDTDFFEQLRSQFGASGGPLAQMYVVGHEWGHHIQQLSGAFERADRSNTGPGSDTIRLEVQADCYAGAWVGAASTIEDSDGVTFLQPVTDAEIADALNAAAAVGDDRIQAGSGGQVDPDTWTHGSAEQRQRWFDQGRTGGATACDTFSVPTDQL